MLRRPLRVRTPLHRRRAGWRLSTLVISLAFVVGGLIGGGRTLL